MKDNADRERNRDLDFYRFVFRMNVVSGILCCLLGLLLIIATNLSMLFILTAFIIFFMANSVLAVIEILKHKLGYGNKSFLILKNVLIFFAGFALLFVPGITMRVLMYFIGGYYILSSGYDLIHAIAGTLPGKYPLRTGILIFTLILGVLVVVYPVSGALVLTVFLGILLFFYGVTGFFHAWIIRQILKKNY
ncbi:MAG: DUF308 domain-containing protein [Spirochaetales bacterium]|nr:DUF308 domain-containing protein [Spirochaetales bacterium]